MPFIAYTNPLRMGGAEPWNLGTWFFTHLLFDQKFISIFAMLFGAGLVLMTGRAETRGSKPGPIEWLWRSATYWKIQVIRTVDEPPKL